MAKEREREIFERARVLVMHHSCFAREMVTKTARIVCGGGRERRE